MVRQTLTSSPISLWVASLFRSTPLTFKATLYMFASVGKYSCLQKSSSEKSASVCICVLCNTLCEEFNKPVLENFSIVWIIDPVGRAAKVLHSHPSLVFSSHICMHGTLNQILTLMALYMAFYRGLVFSC